MLFAVEGGGFFSSSASGYSKGLALLLLGQKPEERPMRVSPLNHYQLVDHGVDTDTKQTASQKKHSPCQCAFFICFGCRSVRLDGSSPPKADAIGKPELSRDSSNLCNKDRVSDSTDENDRKAFFRSSLKRSSTNSSATVGSGDGSDDSEEVQSKISCSDRRNIHWPDACGEELVEIREFEASEAGTSDDETGHEGARRCRCVIQ